MSESDVHFMESALALAQRAFDSGEVPVGAVLVHNEQIIGEGWNQPIMSHDPSAHAEIMAIRSAAKAMQNYRLPGTTLYVTLEPCTMCLGAIMHTRIDRLVFAALEPKAGAVKSCLNLVESDHWNHRIAVEGGVLEQESSSLIKRFFVLRRQQIKELKAQKPT